MQQLETMNQSIADLSTKPDVYFAQTRPEMVPFVPISAKRVLDIGCGEGGFGRALKEQRNAEVWGIELVASAAEIARERLDRVLTGEVLSLIQELPDGHFDCITCNDVLEHLVDPFQVLVQIKRLLAPGGSVVCSIPNIRYFRYFFNFVVKGEWRYEEAGIMDKTHLRFFTKKSIREMFESLGYRVLCLKGITPTSSWRVALFSFCTFGHFEDTKYLQFACVAQPRA